LPSLDGILMDPERANVPHEPSAIAATVSGLAKKASPASIANILKYTSRVSKEYEFLCLKLARRVCPGIEQTRAFAQWAVNNKDFQIAA
jgi:hypothetical protein